MLHDQGALKAGSRNGARVAALTSLWLCILLQLNSSFAQSLASPDQTGLASGYVRLGQMYTEGQAVQRDLQKGVFYYRQAEQAGSEEARLALSVLPYRFEGSGLKRSEALTGLHELAEKGQVSALLVLADIYAGIYGDKPDPAQSLAILEQAADRGSVEAMVKVGNHYREGKIVSYSAEKAIAAYRRAEAAGSRSAAEELAVFQAFGEGMDADMPAAVKRLETATRSGRTAALVTLGDLKLKIGQPNIDVDGAIAAWTRAANEGRIDAFLRLGDFYSNGFFVQRQLKKALSYYKAAADAGDPYGQMYLAQARMMQDSTAKEGLLQLTALADDGFEEAGIAIANGRLRGTGVPQDIKAGLQRLEDMATSGSVLARLRLVEIYRNGLADGYGRLVKPDAKKAAGLLKAVLPTLGTSAQLYHKILLDASTGKVEDPAKLAQRLAALPVSMRQRLFKDLRGDAPDLYFELLQLKLANAGHLAADQEGWKPTIRAMMNYCRNRGVEKVCASGPFAPQTAEALQALL